MENIAGEAGQSLGFRVQGQAWAFVQFRNRGLQRLPLAKGFLPRTTLAAVFARAAYGALMRQETRPRLDQRAAPIRISAFRAFGASPWRMASGSQRLQLVGL